MALKLYYPFNNQDSKDFSLNSNTGTDTSITYSAGDIGYNAVFNSIADRIQVGTFTALNGQTEVSIYFRAKFLSTVGTNYVFYKNGQFYATFDGTTLSVSFVGATGTATTTFTPTLNTYYQIHANYIHNGLANDFSLYIDGTVEDSTTTQGAIVTNSNVLYIGGDGGGVIDTANFELNEIKIFSNSLSINNINSHINNPNGLKIYQPKDMYKLGDIICSNPQLTNKGYAVVTYVSNNDVRVQTLNGYVNNGDKLQRVGNFFNTARQYCMILNGDYIGVYNGVDSAAKAFASSNLSASISPYGLVYYGVTKTANYTATNLDNLIYLDSSGGAFTITLPASPITNKVITLIDKSGNLATYNVTVNGNGKNINGSSTLVLSDNYDAINLIYNGTQWNLK